jgi:predicted nucleotidyltransferase
MTSRLDALLRTDAEARARRARAAAADALRLLAEHGVDARLVGSLARGDFRLHSDVDLLVLRCPAAPRYRIEGWVEEALGGLPFDPLYLDEVAPERRAALESEAVRASDLR